MGDGEIQEGSVWEAAMCAAKHKLDNLTILIDYNKIQSAGMVDDICPLEPLGTKLRAFGFAVSECNGHDIISLRDHLKYLTIMPHCIIANTIKGKGIPVAESNPAYHHKAQMSETELAEWEACLD
jgi:transketolase